MVLPVSPLSPSLGDLRAVSLVHYFRFLVSPKLLQETPLTSISPCPELTSHLRLFLFYTHLTFSSQLTYAQQLPTSFHQRWSVPCKWQLYFCNRRISWPDFNFVKSSVKYSVPDTHYYTLVFASFCTSHFCSKHFSVFLGVSCKFFISSLDSETLRAGTAGIFIP